MAPLKSKKVKSSEKHNCCAPDLPHPDHSEFIPRLKRAQGQLAGIEKMIHERRYCVDILVQMRAAMSALRTVEVSIFEKHLEHCLRSALLSKDEKEIETKIKELTELLLRRSSI